jgi:HAD superfamily hydrolase (TIGR01509 family)
MDGVIVDSNPAHKIALKQFCKKYGKDLTEEELRQKIYGRRNQDWLVKVFGPLEDSELKSYGDEKEQLFREIYHDDIKALEGLEDFLKRLEKAHLVRAIATSAPRANVDFTLTRTNLGRFFTTILDDSYVEEGKPHPDIYLKTARALKADPRNCIVFEDSLAGVQSARAAGCKVIGLTTTHSREELSDTDLVIDDFVGLEPKELISKLF